MKISAVMWLMFSKLLDNNGALWHKETRYIRHFSGPIIVVHLILRHVQTLVQVLQLIQPKPLPCLQYLG